MAQQARLKENKALPYGLKNRRMDCRQPSRMLMADDQARITQLAVVNMFILLFGNIDTVLGEHTERPISLTA